MIKLMEDITNSFNGCSEICSVNFTEHYSNHEELVMKGKLIFNLYKNDILVERKTNELHFHNFLKHQLFSHLQEIKYYSTVDLNTTRRLIAVSHDCISHIHILIRDKIYLNIYFRSSDYDGALPADLEFISELPSDLIDHCERLKDVTGYEECTTKFINKLKKLPVQLDINFGSLHRTNI